MNQTSDERALQKRARRFGMDGMDGMQACKAADHLDLRLAATGGLVRGSLKGPYAAGRWSDRHHCAKDRAAWLAIASGI